MNDLIRTIRGILAATCTLSLLTTPQIALSTDRAAETDFTSMSLKELMALDVFTSANMIPTKSTRAPGTVYSFDQADFVRFGVRRLEDLMQFVPGIQVNQYRKRHKSIWARGLLNRYNDKMILLVDGIRVMHLYYEHFSLGDKLPLEQIDKVEIILGPASSLYGANAFGGIISVTTKDFSQRPELNFSVDAGNHDRRKGTAMYNSEKVQFFGSALAQDAPFRGERKSFIGGPVFQPLDEKYTSIALKTAPIRGLTLRLDYTESETPFLFIPQTQDAYIEDSFLNLSATYEAGNLSEGKLRVSAFHTRDKALEFEVERATGLLGYQENQNAEISGLAIHGLKAFGNHTVAVGVSGQDEKVTNTDFIRSFHFSSGFLALEESGNLLSRINPEKIDYAAFVQDVFKASPELEITLGARYDRFDWFSDDLNYRAAAVYTPTEQRTWKLMYGTAIRTPSLRENLKDLESDFVPPPLSPEELRSLELSYLHQWDAAYVQFTLFKNKVEQFIFEMPTPDRADEYFENLDDVWTFTGAENIFAYQPRHNINTRFALSYIEVRGSQTNDIPYLANWNGSFHIDYEFARNHRFNFSVIYTGNRPDTNGFPEDNPGEGVTTNISFSGTVTKGLNYSVGIDNLLDEKIYHPAGDFGDQYNTEIHSKEFWLKFDWSYHD